jgi:hypothetical protein
MHLPFVTPQGKLLLAKGLAGVLTGLLASYLYPSRLNGFQTFYLVVVIYVLVSMALTGLARKANPPVSVGLYAMFKGITTFFFSMYLTMLSVYIYAS